MIQRILFIENLECFIYLFFLFQLILHCRIIFKSQFSAFKQSSHVPKNFLTQNGLIVSKCLQFHFDFLLLLVNNVDGLHKNCVLQCPSQIILQIQVWRSRELESGVSELLAKYLFNCSQCAICCAVCAIVVYGIIVHFICFCLFLEESCNNYI